MRDASLVRTTLDLDPDVLQAAKEIASAQGTTAGKVISDLVRKALEPAAPNTKMRNGVPLMPSRPRGPHDQQFVNELLDEP